MKYYEDMNKVIQQIDKASEKALMKCWFYLENQIKKEMKKDSYDTWMLVRSINTRKISSEEVLVWTNLEYALVREYGRKPWKFPPLDALVGWSARKGMISWWATSRYDDLHYLDKGIVYIIARSIAENGIEGKYTFQKVYEREKQNLIDLYTETLNQWL